MASRPRSPEPGSTRRPSSVNTAASSPSWNRAVPALRPRLATEAPKPLPSDDPSKSINSAGTRASSASFWGPDHMAPDDVITFNEVRS